MQKGLQTVWFFRKKIKYLEYSAIRLTIISSSISGKNRSKKRLWSFFTKRLFFFSVHVKITPKRPEIVDNGDNSGYNSLFQCQIMPFTNVDNSVWASRTPITSGWVMPRNRFFTLWTFLLDRKKRSPPPQCLILFVRLWCKLSDCSSGRPLLSPPARDWLSEPDYDTLTAQRHLRLPRIILTGGNTKWKRNWSLYWPQA